MQKLYKTMFMMSMMMGTLITISANNWLGMWMGLEINLMSIIPLMSSQKNACESESALKYFVTQAMASTMLLLSMILTMSDYSSIQSMEPTYSTMMMNASMLTKMGVAPFHFWFTEVINGLPWTMVIIVVNWQKIAPTIVLINSNKSNSLLITAIISSMLISGLMGINQTSLRKIMAYSSINHMGWMLGAILSNQAIWLMYMIIYTMTSNATIWMFMSTSSFTMNQLMNSMNESKQLKLILSLNLLSMGGLPPFLGFLPKWMTINFMIEEQMFMMALLMIVLTLPTMYFYMRTAFTWMTLGTLEMKIKSKPELDNLTIMLNSISLLGLPISTLMLNFL